MPQLPLGADMLRTQAKRPLGPARRQVMLMHDAIPSFFIGLGSGLFAGWCFCKAAYYFRLSRRKGPWP